MNCGNCGVQNVEFATTCYSCGQGLGSKFRASPAPSTAGPHSAPETSMPRPSGIRLGGIIRFLIAAAVLVWIFREPLRAIQSMQFPVDSSSEAPTDVAPATEPEPAGEAAPAAEPEAAAPEEAAPEPPPAPPGPPMEDYPVEQGDTEINGFTMKVFSWILPPGRPKPVIHFGETVHGRSEIGGFEVSSENRIDLTMSFAFRDPKGKLIEPESKTRLDQEVESDTLYSTFDYAIPETGPAGNYELTIGVDDAVSGRSVRFRRTIKAVK